MIRKNFPSAIFIEILKWQGLGCMLQMCYDIPPNELLAGFACRHNSGANTSVEHLKFLDGVCAILKLHAHPSIEAKNLNHNRDNFPTPLYSGSI